MAKKEDALFQEWLEDIEERIEDEDLKERFHSFVDHPIGKEIFRGHLREADYHRKAQAVAEERKLVEAEREQLNSRAAELEAWYEQNRPINERLKEERDALRARLEAEAGGDDELPRSHRGESAVDDLTKKELEALRAEVEQSKAWAKQVDVGVPSLMAGFMQVATEIVKNKYDVSPKAVVEYAMKMKIDPETALMQMTAEERQKRAEAEIEAKVAKAREEGRREALKSQVASPDRLRQTTPAVWMQFKSKDAPDRSARLDAAVEAFIDAADN